MSSTQWIIKKGERCKIVFINVTILRDFGEIHLIQFLISLICHGIRALAFFHWVREGFFLRDRISSLPHNPNPLKPLFPNPLTRNRITCKPIFDPAPETLSPITSHNSAHTLRKNPNPRPHLLRANPLTPATHFPPANQNSIRLHPFTTYSTNTNKTKNQQKVLLVRLKAIDFGLV